MRSHIFVPVTCFALTALLGCDETRKVNAPVPPDVVRPIQTVTPFQAPDAQADGGAEAGDGGIEAGDRGSEAGDAGADADAQGDAGSAMDA